ncbi:MAG: LysR substrate-binding domain-containing protein [Rikenellaceae bacterium]
MNDFRLIVFLSVARNLNFTKAAQELGISQPAISKHINELESNYGVQLFERSKSKVTLTSSGEVFKAFAQSLVDKYKDLEFEMNLLSHNDTGEIVIGASTTIAQYVLPKIISKFMSRFPNIKLSLVSGNTNYIESLISSNKIDLGLVEGATHKKDFHYRFFAHDELVLISSTKNKVEEVSLQELLLLPLVLRENGSGTLEVIINELKDRRISLSELNLRIQLGSSEAIKRYVIDGNSYAIVSVAAIIDELKHNELRIIDIKDVELKRDFSFISRIGSQNRLAEKFADFTLAITKSYYR